MAVHDDDEFDPTTERPWIVLKTTYDVETWIDHQNRHLQRHAGKSKPERCGLCFHLTLGGTIYLHTTQEGDILLDVPEDAAWVAPAITATTGATSPQGQIWALPSDVLTQLVLGLSPLVAATDIVTDHDFRARRR